MKATRIFLAGLMALGLSSCKDFLDVEPTNMGKAETSIKTPADAQIMVNGLMNSMTDVNYYGRNFIMYGDAKGGDLAVYSQGRGLDALYTFNHTATTNSFSGIWLQIYNGIHQANNILESIATIEATAPNASFDTYKGQALTARAIMHFDLVRLYGKSYDDDKSSFGVPNVTTRLGSEAQPLRATVEQNYTQILADLTTAAPLLPKTITKGYINYYTNLAMQARVYLYMKDYENALKTAEEVISKTALYSLYSNAAWVASWKTPFGSESIFELGVFPTENDLGTSGLGVYLRRNGHGSNNALGQFLVSDYYLNRLRQDPNDVRWSILARDETSATRMGSLYKYSGSTTLEGDGKATNTAVNIKVIRLSEIYLIAAEAALPTDKAKAVTYLNAIRKRAPNLAPATQATINLDMILDERSKELLGEGHRFFDMIRLNKTITFNDELGGLSVSGREKSINRGFYKTRLPISQTEINANPGLKAQQNEGY
ncbi:RagB/SusD family nutrient uptake outer membrane protein [Arcticibacter tournemirensis]|uniref:RagB/SusD family nutrient uptake outer membrane protein n=1 Tax=Arcticibacter tournemirensis TaxID=699437 RepID=A0A4Q0M7J2_9SPHI|nr:RagB/SusD family nutrient uptake outer membrane protein [Arcticibacter tournemirensis]RXF68853.1 RagB/SusD family nutrient uptake outer membrane protein [Arcticibacter tournemirensis]